MNAAIMEELRRRHAEPHRALHGWSRVAALLAEAEDLAGAVADRPAFILAILFHAAIFNRAEARCAERSTDLMRALLGPTVHPATLDRAATLILAMARGDLPETQDPSLRGDAALLLDMAHANLAAPPVEFAAIEAANRREFAHLTEDRYGAGRAAQLRTLLWRDRLFRTDRYYLAHERAARANLAALLERIEG